MNGNKVLRVLKIVVIVTVAVNLFGFVVMRLWNWLMPAIFGVHAVTFLQALGLMVLGKILFGGFHRHGGGWRGRRWKYRMAEQWERMTPEERERFRAGMQGRWGCGPQRDPEPSQGQG
jgi:hypothetical protein